MEDLTSHPGGFNPGTHWIGGWVGPQVGLNAMEKRKNLYCRDSNPGLRVRSLSAYRLSYPVKTTACVVTVVNIEVTVLWD
jgi:hypothetical protein